MHRPTSLTRRAALRRVLAMSAATIALPAFAQTQGPIRVRDLLGREVRLSRPASRIVLGQGRFLSMLGMVHPDPASLLVGWADDLTNTFPGEAQAWTDRFPALKQLPVIGRRAASDYAIEHLLMLDPDLVLISKFNAGPVNEKGSSAFIEMLTNAGLNVAVVDFAQDPLNDTVPSLRILGELLGQQTMAKAAIDFYQAGMTRITSAFSGKPLTPVNVLFHSHAGIMPCCASIGRGSFADLAERVGGHSIAADVLQRAVGPLNLEYILTHQPDVYVATGGLRANRTNGLLLGAGVSEEAARASLARNVDQPGLDQLDAIKLRRAHALWHGLNETPLHLVALEALAGWINPQLKASFKPNETLAAFRERFPALPQSGVYTVSLDADT